MKFAASTSLLLYAAVAGCALPQTLVAQPVRARADIVPMVDAHQHLWSPATAANASDIPRATVKLPEDLDAFLKERMRAATSKAALPKLYVEGAWFLESFNPSWVQSRDSIVAWWIGATDTPYDLEPVGYGREAASAHIVSYLRDSKTKKIDAHVMHSLAKGTDGRWRITTETLTMGSPTIRPVIAANDLVALLDSAGIRRALLLSVAFQFASGRDEKAGEYPKVRAENDWNAAQASMHPDRLRAFCSFNPLRSYALQEIDRCAKSGNFRGIKLHMGNSGVDFTNPQDVDRLRQVFRAADDRRLAIVVHLATWGVPYGRAQAETFLREVLTAAPAIPVQIAHMASPGHLDPRSDSALAVLAEAVAAGEPRTKNLWFDVTTVAWPGMSAANARLVATRIRQVGVGRVLYGSDTPDKDHPAPREGWALFRDKVPLTDDELRTIANNLPPYAR